MLYYRCRCGKQQAWGSMPPPRCAGCPECGTDLALAPGRHGKPEPHLWEAEMVETDEGPKPLTRCRWCGRTRKELEAGDASLRR